VLPHTGPHYSVVLATFLTLALYLDRLVMRFQVVIVRFVSNIDHASVGTTLQSHMILRDTCWASGLTQQGRGPGGSRELCEGQSDQAFLFPCRLG
jgi:hypothetical protein